MESIKDQIIRQKRLIDDNRKCKSYSDFLLCKTLEENLWSLYKEAESKGMLTGCACGKVMFKDDDMCECCAAKGIK